MASTLPHTPLTVRVTNAEFGDLASAGVQAVGPIQQGHCALHEPHTTGKVKWGVPTAVTHQRVRISSEGGAEVHL